jgi:dienelactone hydrolase
LILGSQPELSAVAIAHPGGIQLDDFEKVMCPTLFLCAETDRAFPDEQRDAGREILEKRGIWNKFCVYPGTEHGFAVWHKLCMD